MQYVCCIGEGVRTLKKKYKQRYWFFTNQQLVSMVAIFCLGVLGQVGNVAVNLKFLAAQKAVQNGNLDVWKVYLITLLALSVFSVLSSVYMTWFHETLTRYLQFNLFKRYRRCFRVMEKGVLMKYNIVYAELCLPLAVVTALLGVYLIIKTMAMVTFSVGNIVVGVMLLLTAMICGVMRGRCESRRKIQSTVIQEKKNDLTKFDSFSTNALEDALYVLDIEYRGAMKQSLMRIFYENLPRFLKQALYVILVWGFVATMASGEVYSESFLILTAFGTVLSIAEELGKIFEKTFEILQMRKDSNVMTVDEFERKEKALVEKNRGAVSLTERGLEISTDFSLDVKSAIGKTRYYKLTRKLELPRGEHVIFSGEKEVGKTRFLTFIETLFPFATMIYNDNSKIFNQFYDNFKTAHGFDGELIRELARGLRLKRFVDLSDEELKAMQITNINTGDKHLCVALVMLYFAIKAPETARIIIFDELLANVDEANSKKILAFIMEKVKEIGSTVVFVGHSQQELIKQYCSSQIKLFAEDTVIVVDQNVF